MHLRPGERITVQNLLEGMLIASGNDAATALAYRVSGNPRAFVGAMNAKASAIGMTSTVFRNPTGLPAAGQTTTARAQDGLYRQFRLQHHRHGKTGRYAPPYHRARRPLRRTAQHGGTGTP